MIYNRETIALLMRLCKLISGEFNVRLHLNDPEIVIKIKSLLAVGGSPEVLLVWRSVLDHIGDVEPPAPSAAPHRIYRGQVVPEPPHTGPANEPAPEAPMPTAERPRSVRIYRGQVVR